MEAAPLGTVDEVYGLPSLQKARILSIAVKKEVLANAVLIRLEDHFWTRLYREGRTLLDVVPIVRGKSWI